MGATLLLRQGSEQNGGRARIWRNALLEEWCGWREVGEQLLGRARRCYRAGRSRALRPWGSLGAATGEEEIEHYDYGGSRIITIKNKIGLKPPHQKLPPAKAPQNKMTKNQQLLRWGLKRREIKERANHDANH
uniref:RpoA n=1 Tax=Arundo donax TaxID=35708 RepID=A0A0A9CPR2_ARUDO